MQYLSNVKDKEKKIYDEKLRRVQFVKQDLDESSDSKMESVHEQDDENGEDTSDFGNDRIDTDSDESSVNLSLDSDSSNEGNIPVYFTNDQKATLLKRMKTKKEQIDKPKVIET